MTSTGILRSLLWVTFCVMGKRGIIAGSTYEHNQNNTQLTEQAYRQILHKLFTILPGLSGRIVKTGQHAGIRVTTPNKLPAIGSPSAHPGVHIYTALGSKGLLFSEYVAGVLSRPFASGRCTTTRSGRQALRVMNPECVPRTVAYPLILAAVECNRPQTGRYRMLPIATKCYLITTDCYLLLPAVTCCYRTPLNATGRHLLAREPDSGRWVCSVPISHGCLEHPLHRLTIFIVHSIQSQLNRFRLFVEPESSCQAVPDRKQGAVIGVGFRLPAGMVNPMHIRRDNNHPQQSVDALGQADVGVMKLNYGKHEHLVENQLPEIHTEQHNQGDAEQGREEDFAHMKPAGRGHIHRMIGMMDLVKPPEKTGIS